MTAITLANICPRCYHEHLYYNDEPCVSCECEYEVEEWLRIKLAEIQLSKTQRSVTIISLCRRKSDPG